MVGKPDDTERLLGDHGARIEHLEDDKAAINKRLDGIAACQIEIKQLLSQAKGGWKTLTAIGAIAAAILTTGLHWWFWWLRGGGS